MKSASSISTPIRNESFSFKKKIISSSSIGNKDKDKDYENNNHNNKMNSLLSVVSDNDNDNDKEMTNITEKIATANQNEEDYNCWIESWVLQVNERLKNIRHIHEKNRKLLEKNLESKPMESKFSSHLLDLMKKEEELILYNNNHNVKEKEKEQQQSALNKMAQKVNTTLKKETTKHFVLQTEYNLKKWNLLLSKQVLQRGAYLQEIENQMKHILNTLNKDITSYLASARFNVSIDLNDILNNDNENEDDTYTDTDTDNTDTDTPLMMIDDGKIERALNRENLQKWEENQSFTLKNAFQSQQTRVETEWMTYETSMEKDFHEQKMKIEEKYNNNNNNNNIYHSSSSTIVKQQQQQQQQDTISRKGSWKSKEKQSRLIHTAPVHSPNVRLSSSSKSTSTSASSFSSLSLSDVDIEKAKVNRKKKEIHDLEKAFQAAKVKIKDQKQIALRWIERQRTRMLVRLHHVKNERQYLYEFLEQEEMDFAVIQKKMEYFCIRICPSLMCKKNNNNHHQQQKKQHQIIMENLNENKTKQKQKQKQKQSPSLLISKKRSTLNGFNIPSNSLDINTSIPSCSVDDNLTAATAAGGAIGTY